MRTVARHLHVGEVFGKGSAGREGPRKTPRSPQGRLRILFIDKLKESETLTNLHLLGLVEKDTRRPIFDLSRAWKQAELRPLGVCSPAGTKRPGDVPRAPLRQQFV